MAEGPFEPENTDWGKKIDRRISVIETMVQRRHNDNLVRFDKIDGDLTKIDDHIKSDVEADAILAALVEHRHAQISKIVDGIKGDMVANTELTQAVKIDTSLLRANNARMSRLCDEWFGVQDSSPGAKDGEDGVRKQIMKALELRRLAAVLITIILGLAVAVPGIFVMWDRLHGH